MERSSEVFTIAMMVDGKEGVFLSRIQALKNFKRILTSDNLHRLYMTYSKNNNKAPFTEPVIFFSLGISNFAAGHETEASNFFRMIVDHPSYTSIREQFDEFANQYANRIPNMGLKTLLGNCFLSVG